MFSLGSSGIKILSCDLLILKEKMSNLHLQMSCVEEPTKAVAGLAVNCPTSGNLTWSFYFFRINSRVSLCLCLLHQTSQMPFLIISKYTCWVLISCWIHLFTAILLSQSHPFCLLRSHPTAWQRTVSGTNHQGKAMTRGLFVCSLRLHLPHPVVQTSNHLTLPLNNTAIS